MSQRIVDVKTSDVNVADITKIDLTTVTEPEKVPTKFHGKTVQDILASYEHLEKEDGRKAAELGELRRLTDTLIQQNLKHSNTPAEEQHTLTDEEFLEKPLETIQKIVADAVKPLKASNDEVRKSQAVAMLEQKHPDMRKLVDDQAFQEWVMASPVRQANWQRAANGDFDYADDIFSTYKELHKETTPVTKTFVKNNQALEDASAISAGASRDTRTINKPVYRRSDLVRLQIEDPLKYQSLQGEIMLAYQEKRVVT